MLDVPFFAFPFSDESLPSPGRPGPSPPIPKSANAIIAHAHANPWSSSMHEHQRPRELAIGHKPTEWHSQFQSEPWRRSSPPPVNPKSPAAPPTPPKAVSTTDDTYGASTAVATHPRMDLTEPIESNSAGTLRSAACDVKCATATRKTAKLRSAGRHEPAAATAADPTARHSAAARLLVLVGGMTSTYASRRSSARVVDGEESSSLRDSSFAL